MVRYAPQPRAYKWTSTKTLPNDMVRAMDLKQTRYVVKNSMQETLVAATGRRSSKMTYALEEYSGDQKLIYKESVECMLPPHIDFASPGSISSLPKLGEILVALRTGAIWFRRVTYEEIEDRLIKSGIRGLPSRHARSDAGSARQLRHPATRSKRLRKFTGIHTTEHVPEGADDDEIEDARTVRQLRPLATRSMRLQKFTRIHTTEDVPEGVDDDEIEDFEDDTASTAAAADNIENFDEA